ncbi:hypothetical protein C2G38_2150549 [Gigaspora rosea]|uniref:Uncharacterized protein n=1 Tax=Gigaspora rosea TaxID=44941 RepID=A0A397TSY1_9GLOM|nr:hypothetical protein C2G38_2150549 [Gigaspora rosea]
MYCLGPGFRCMRLFKEELSISRCTDYSENLETYRTTENLTNSTIALDNSSQNYCSNFNDSTANSVNGITDNILKQSPPIIDQQQVINIFRNGNQGYKKYITKLRLFAITREFQEQNSNLLSQNKVLQIKIMRLKKKSRPRNRYHKSKENTNLKVNNKEVKKRNHILGKDITKLKKITKLEIKLGDISKKYSDLLTEHLNLEVIYAALQDSYKALQAKDGNNEEEIKNLKKELKETREEKDKVKKRLVKDY